MLAEKAEATAAEIAKVAKTGATHTRWSYHHKSAPPPDLLPLPGLLPSTNKPMGMRSDDSGHVLRKISILGIVDMLCGSCSPLKGTPPKQGEHTCFPDNSAFASVLHPAAVKRAL